MENKEIYEELKKVIDETKSNAFKWILINPKEKNPGITDFKKSDRYEPWKLEPLHIAEKLGLTESELKKLIYDTEDVAIINMWNDFINLKNLALFHDNNYAMIKKELAEFSISLYNKTDTMKVDVIIKPIEKDSKKLMLTISKLEKELKYFRGGKDGKFTS